MKGMFVGNFCFKGGKAHATKEIPTAINKCTASKQQRATRYRLSRGINGFKERCS